jgi:hypothetical protein
VPVWDPRVSVAIRDGLESVVSLAIRASLGSAPVRGDP